MERKRDRSVQIKQHQRQFLQYKALTQAQQREEITRQYAMKEQARNKSINDVVDKMRQLESVEQYLIEQLGKTQTTQKKALENLHSVVQLCNQKIEPSFSASVSQRNPSSPSLLKKNKSNMRFAEKVKQNEYDAHEKKITKC